MALFNNTKQVPSNCTGQKVGSNFQCLLPLFLFLSPLAVWAVAVEWFCMCASTFTRLGIKGENIPTSQRNRWVESSISMIKEPGSFSWSSSSEPRRLFFSGCHQKSEFWKNEQQCGIPNSLLVSVGEDTTVLPVKMTKTCLDVQQAPSVLVKHSHSSAAEKRQSHKSDIVHPVW